MEQKERGTLANVYYTKPCAQADAPATAEYQASTNEGRDVEDKDMLTADRFSRRLAI